MPALKGTYIILSGIILAAILGLGIMSLGYNRAFHEPSRMVMLTLLAIIFSLLCVSFGLILYNLNKRLKARVKRDRKSRLILPVSSAW